MLVNKINYTTPNFQARIIIDKKNIELMTKAAMSAGTSSSAAALATGSEMEAIAHSYESNICESAREICENSPLRNLVHQLWNIIPDNHHNGHDPLTFHMMTSVFSSGSGVSGGLATDYLSKLTKSKNIPS